MGVLMDCLDTGEKVRGLVVNKLQAIFEKCCLMRENK